uniref:Parathion hydrolase-related protein n=1 Tax=Glossina austeni TaxID=7395 RepID=A0A1A9V2L4_GLOAU
MKLIDEATSFGGHGYHHVIMNVLPRMFAKGLTPYQAEQITVVNPTNWFSLVFKNFLMFHAMNPEGSRHKTMHSSAKRQTSITINLNT